jgi:hypothetical protein
MQIGVAIFFRQFVRLTAPRYTAIFKDDGTVIHAPERIERYAVLLNVVCVCDYGFGAKDKCHGEVSNHPEQSERGAFTPSKGEPPGLVSIVTRSASVSFRLRIRRFRMLCSTSFVTSR